MKIILSLTIVFILGSSIVAQTYATNTTPVDCQGNPHNIFSNLDAGKIIVIGWTMPCGSCAAPLLNAHNAVLNFAISNPGIVEFWLTDDYANTSCSSVQNWGESTGINNAFYFSTSELYMKDYGTDGMPKVVVLGCTDHKVYFNKNNSVSESEVTAAINSALTAMAGGCQTSGIDDLTDSKLGLSCYPNPTSTVLNVRLTLKAKEILTLGLYNIDGSLLRNIPMEQLNSQDTEIQLQVGDLSEGMYLLKASNGDINEMQKFQIAH